MSQHVLILNIAELRCLLTTNLANLSAVNLEDRLVLNCSCIGMNDNISVEWKKDGKLFNESSSIVSKNNVTREDAGKYECILVKGHQRSERCIVSVNVNGKYHNF